MGVEVKTEVFLLDFLLNINRHRFCNYICSYSAERCECRTCETHECEVCDHMVFFEGCVMVNIYYWVKRHYDIL
jgi:hypothetical protein